MSELCSNRDQPLAAPPLRTDTLADSVVILLVLTGVQRLIGFCRALLFCRWLDAEQLGLWDMAWGFLVLGAPLAVLSLPGAFGRYVEPYRQQRQLRTLLRRTTAVCAALALVAAASICWGRAGFSRLVFDTPDAAGLAVLLALALLAVISFNFLHELIIALRNARLASMLQLVNSIVFAGLGAYLILGWRAGAGSVVLAYGGACLVSTLAGAWWIQRVWRSLPADGPPLSHRALWTRLMPFAAWIWIVNLLTNLFDVAGRYMVLHYSRAGDALAMLGEYHSSRVLPLILVSLAALLGAILTPHLSCDWESGRRERVALRLRLFLKGLAFGLTLAGVAMLLVAPLVFGAALRGKFPGAEAVLPWTITYCAWLALATVAMIYLWCAEKAPLAAAALLGGLVVNVAANLILLPRLGLLGSVLGTSAGALAVLLLVCAMNAATGFRPDRGLWLMLALPPMVCLGPWLALLMLATVALEAAASHYLLDPDEKAILAEAWTGWLGRLKGWAVGGRQRAVGSGP